MPKGGSSNIIAMQQTSSGNREKIFYFLEGLGTLLWVLGDVSWIFELEYIYPIIYILAVLGNFAALTYAFLRFRHTIPFLPILGYNLWVIMGCLWAIVDATGFEKVLIIAKIIGVAMLLITVWEFMLNRNNQENLFTFIKMFRKFRIREDKAGLNILDMLSLSDDLFDLIKWMVEQGRVGLEEVAAFMKQDEITTSKTLAFLIERGYIREKRKGGKTHYSVRLNPGRRLNIPSDWPEASSEGVQKP